MFPMRVDGLLPTRVGTPPHQLDKTRGNVLANDRSGPKTDQDGHPSYGHPALCRRWLFA